MYRTGYCCINLSVDERFRTMRLGWAAKNAKDIVRNKWNEIIVHNFGLLYKIIDWNITNKVYLYRISSDLVPLADHPNWRWMWGEWRGNIENAPVVVPLRDLLKRYLSLGGRITMHPGQFVSLGSVSENIRNNSINNLEYHGQLLDLLGLPNNYFCPINIHVSNGSKDPKVTAQLVRESCDKMSQSVTSRLTFENEQSGCWTVENLRENFPNIPITFDYHHYNINNGVLDIGAAICIASESWPNNDPIQHYSEGRAHDMDPSHSDMIRDLPTTPYDIEVEAKSKDLAIKDFLFERNRLIGGVIY